MRVEIFDTGFQGYGVGKTEDGKNIFIPYSVAGDILDVTITEDKKNFTYGVIDKIIQPSPMRKQEPICKHFGVCGGCQSSHIKYDELIKIKRDILANSSGEEPSKVEIIPSERLEKYRNRVNFYIDSGRLCFKKINSNSLVYIDECPILKERIFSSAEKIAAKCKKENRLYIISNTEDQMLGYLSEYEEGIVEPLVDEFVGFKNGGFTYKEHSLVHHTAYGDVYSSFNSFFQGNESILDAFQNKVYEYAKSFQKPILELYAGSGFFTRVLMSIKNKSKGIILGVEINKESVELGKQLMINIVQGNVDVYVTRTKDKYKSLLLNPPRSGLSTRVINFINRHKPKELIYISCNPSVINRDISSLEGYRIKNIALVDNFPDSYHIESIIHLEKV